MFAQDDYQTLLMHLIRITTWVNFPLPTNVQYFMLCYNTELILQIKCINQSTIFHLFSQRLIN